MEKPKFYSDYERILGEGLNLMRRIMADFHPLSCTGVDLDVHVKKPPL